MGRLASLARGGRGLGARLFASVAASGSHRRIGTFGPRSGVTYFTCWKDTIPARRVIRIRFDEDHVCATPRDFFPERLCLEGSTLVFPGALAPRGSGGPTPQRVRILK